MKRPLLLVALLYGGGIIIADARLLPWWPVLIASLAVGACALLLDRMRPWLLGLLLILAGAASQTFHSTLLSPADLRRIVGNEPVIVNVRASLAETPYLRVRGDPEDEEWRSLAQLEVHAIQRKGREWQPASGRVMASTPGVLSSSFFKGQAVEVNGVLRQPKGPLAEGLFDYNAYLRRLGIHYQLLIDLPSDWKPLAPAARVLLADRFAAWAKTTLAQGLPEEDEPLRLLWAMTLGWKTALNGEVTEPFMRSGTMHIFAISGLHVALIAGILVGLFRLMRVPRNWCGGVIIPLLWAYTAATGWQASAARSTVMMSVVIFGWSLRRPSDLLNSLAAAAFLILLWDPQQLFQAGFQLSFSVVLSLALLEPLAVFLRERAALGDPLQPRELMPTWKRWLDVALRWLVNSAATSLAAWIGSIPLVAHYFHLFTPVSLLANLIVVPLSSFALASNLASLLTGAWWPWGTEVFNHGAWWWMRCMVSASEWAAGLPGAWCHLATPSWLGFLCYYSLLLALALQWLTALATRNSAERNLQILSGEKQAVPFQRERSKLNRPAARVGVAAVLMALVLLWLGQRARDHFVSRLTVIPLGGGDAIYFKAPGEPQLLVDCGNESAVEFATKPFLAAQGVNRLPKLILTHGDLKHVGGVPILDHAFTLREISASPIQFRSPAYRRLQQQWRESQRPFREIQRGDQFGPWNVLHPDADDRFTQADDFAIVLLGSIRGTRVLLLSDLGKPGQNALMNRYPDLRADIVITGLPVQSEPVADALLDALKPRLLIVTDAEYPASERTSASVRERLARRTIPVLYTRETRAVTIEWRGPEWSVCASNGLRLRGSGLRPGK